MGNCFGCRQREIPGPVGLDHFKLMRAIGRGAFGKVLAVKKRDTRQLYALKYINKAACIKQKAVKNIVRERKLLEELESPFICNLRYAFQDDANVYMCLDFMEGGDLRFHLNQRGCFTETVVRYMISEIALGLEYIHAHDVVHRDIKPANILVDATGHCHITDFNVAARAPLDCPMTSTAGTYKYMAPEVLQRTPYTTEPDWWSLGVLMFECLYGRCPFKGRTRKQITENICSSSISYPTRPPQVVSSDARAAIKAFLRLDKVYRLGCSFQTSFKEHPFFASVEFAKLVARSPDCLPPFVPDLTEPNYDLTHSIEGTAAELRPLWSHFGFLSLLKRSWVWQPSAKPSQQVGITEHAVRDQSNVNSPTRSLKQKEISGGECFPPDQQAAWREMMTMYKEFQNFDHTLRHEKILENIQKEIPNSARTFAMTGQSMTERRDSETTTTGDFAAHMDDLIKEFDGKETGNTTEHSLSPKYGLNDINSQSG